MLLTIYENLLSWKINKYSSLNSDASSFSWYLCHSTHSIWYFVFLLVVNLNFGLTWAYEITKELLRLGWKYLRRQNLILQNYIDSLVDSMLTQRIVSQRLDNLGVVEQEFTRSANTKSRTYELGSPWSSIYSLSESKVNELVDFVVVGRA